MRPGEVHDRHCKVFNRKIDEVQVLVDGVLVESVDASRLGRPTAGGDLLGNRIELGLGANVTSDRGGMACASSVARLRQMRSWISVGWDRSGS